MDAQKFKSVCKLFLVYFEKVYTNNFSNIKYINYLLIALFFTLSNIRRN